MIAILLSKKNARLIASSTTGDYPLTEEQVLEKVDMPNLVNPGEPVYFIPNYVSLMPNVPSGGWATIPEHAFLDIYVADMDKITTQFVEITRK